MIRKATPEDADAVAPLLVQALGHIAGIFAGSENYEAATPLVKTFFERDDNQYSYINTLVFEDETGVIGSVTGYDGARLHELRQPVIDRLREFQPDFTPGDETEAGEYYIDCASVDPAHQGKGIGKKLITAFCELAASSGFEKVGLIVDKVNPAAKRLYEDLGFDVAGEKDFLGHRYFHMVRKVL
ncbi:GNAT family N-acetyltransferase [Dyadobacter pollutisoli]|jgi:ribosomal protein S18 acetylase RimI-like enzyme|uniref:GNAT family N-acetyltransferase n=1 Tax=Dyadobacter pollutisoli TaxID=2910158 RepID=A0A9E8SK46_9BACT|nr:GNAT family N-acetyltransferase [Dyadobacter pollutisoli]WAC11583.1 GNAT family N-acetyltransferase [Dyadobacter pollutisoli]